MTSRLQVKARLILKISLFAALLMSACSQDGADITSPLPASSIPDSDPIEPIDPAEPELPDEPDSVPSPQPPPNKSCRTIAAKYDIRKTYLSQIKKAETFVRNCSFDEVDLLFTCTEAKYIEGSPGITLSQKWAYEQTEHFIKDINFFRFYLFVDKDNTIYLNILDFDDARLISYYKFDANEDLSRIGKVVERNSANLPILIEEEDPSDNLCDDFFTYEYTNEMRIEKKVRTIRAGNGGGCDVLRESRLEYRYLDSGLLDRMLETIVSYDPVTDETSIEINRYNFFYEEFMEYCE